MKIKNRHLKGLPLLGAAIGTQTGVFIGKFYNSVLAYSNTGLFLGFMTGLVLALIVTFEHSNELKKRVAHYRSFLGSFEFDSMLGNSLSGNRGSLKSR